MAFILLVIAGFGDDITAIHVGLVFSGIFMMADIIDYKHKKTFIRTDKGKNKNKICNLILTHIIEAFNRVPQKNKSVR